MRGVYTATSVMVASLDYQRLVTRNIANASTPGFKSDQIRFRDFESLILSLEAGEDDELGLGVKTEPGGPDLGQGGLRETERELDLAISGTAFFTVQTPQGVRLTRDGRFGVDADRTLVTAEGHQVLGVNGPITLPEGEVTVNQTGQVFANGQPVAALNLVVVQDAEALTRVGDNLFEGQYAQATAADATIYQGYLESSNVDIADNVAKMTALLRTFETAQRIILMQSQVTDEATNRVGSV